MDQAAEREVGRERQQRARDTTWFSSFDLERLYLEDCLDSDGVAAEARGEEATQAMERTLERMAREEEEERAEQERRRRRSPVADEQKSSPVVAGGGGRPPPPSSLPCRKEACTGRKEASSTQKALTCFLVSTYAYADSEGKAALWSILLAPFVAVRAISILKDAAYLVREDFAAFVCPRGLVIYAPGDAPSSAHVYLLVPTDKGGSPNLLAAFVLWKDVLCADVWLSPLCVESMDTVDSDRYSHLQRGHCRTIRSAKEARTDCHLTRDGRHVRLSSTGLLLPVRGHLESARRIALFRPLSRCVDSDLSSELSSGDRLSLFWVRASRSPEDGAQAAAPLLLVENVECDAISATLVSFRGCRDGSPEDVASILEAVREDGERALVWVLRLLSDETGLERSDAISVRLGVAGIEAIPSFLRRMLIRAHFREVGLSDEFLNSVLRGGFTLNDGDSLVRTLVAVWSFLTQDALHVRDFRRFACRLHRSGSETWVEWFSTSDHVHGLVCRADASSVVALCRLFPRLLVRVNETLEQHGVSATRARGCVTKALVAANMASRAVEESWREFQKRYDSVFVESSSAPRGAPVTVGRKGPPPPPPDDDASRARDAKVDDERTAPTTAEAREAEPFSRAQMALVGSWQRLRFSTPCVVAVHLIGSSHFYEGHDVDVVVQVDDDDSCGAAGSIAAATGWTTTRDASGQVLLRGICPATRLSVDAQVVCTTTLAAAREGREEDASSRLDTRAARAVVFTERLLAKLTDVHRHAVRDLHEWMDVAECKGALFGRMSGVAVTVCATKLAGHERVPLTTLLQRFLDELDVAVPLVALDDDGPARDDRRRARENYGPEAPLSVVAMDKATVLTSRMTTGTTRMLYHVIRWALPSTPNPRTRLPTAAGSYRRQLAENTVCVLLLRPKRVDSACRTAHVMMARMEQHIVVDAIGLYAAGKAEGGKVGGEMYEVRVLPRSSATADMSRYGFGKESVRVREVVPLRCGSYAKARVQVGSRSRDLLAVSARLLSAERTTPLEDAQRARVGSHLRLPHPHADWCVPNAPSLTTDLACHVPQDMWEVV